MLMEGQMAAQSGRASEPASHPYLEASAEGRQGLRLLVVFVFLSFAIGAIGWWGYKVEAEHLRQNVSQELKAIADFKAAQIEDWLDERRQDAMVLVANASFRNDVENWLQGGAAAAGERLAARLGSLRANKHYTSVELLDPQGGSRLTIGGARPGRAELSPARLEAIGRENAPQLIDLHRDAAGLVLAYIVPVRHENADKVLGFVRLAIDPQARLYPLMQSWPTPSPSAETLIVRREGDAVVFLNELRHRQNTALDFSLPLSRSSLPAVKAVLGGREIFTGIDYRGVEVLSYLRPVAGTPWSMVAKVDQGEVFGNIERIAWFVFFGVAVAIGTGGTVLWQLWRRQGMQARRRMEEGLARLADLSPGLIHAYALRPDGTACFPHASPAIEEIYGFPPETLGGDAAPVLACIHADDRQRLDAGMAESIRSGSAWHAEYRYAHPAKSEVWLERYMTPERQADGSIVWHGFVIDISARKLAEWRLHRLAAVVERIAAAHDMGSLMAIVRTAVRELTGADGATLVLREGERCHYADEDAVGPLWKGQRFPLEQCISGWSMLHGEAVAIEDIYADPRIPHDAYRPTFVKSLSMVPIGRDRAVGSIGCYWASPHLATPEELGLQQALADAMAVGIANLALIDRLEAEQARLEDEVALRTAELTKANQELQAFTYAASHDLKAPLRGVNCFAELLERHYRDRLDEQGRGFIDYIRQCVTKMADLIDNLLAYTKIEQRSDALEPINLQALVRELVAERRAEIEQFGVGVKIGLPAAIVLADPDGLAQVLRNLVDNALKYRSQAYPPLLEIDGDVADGRYRFWVRDNGIGFDMAYHDRIFEMFRRLHTYEEYHGSGVGLALVKKAMERMGGRVWAESTPGAGATFFVELPGELRRAA